MKAKSNLYLKQEDAFISVDYDDTPDLKFASYNKFIIDNKKVPFHGNLIINNISYINPRVLNRNPETLACLHDYFHRNNILGNMNAVNCIYNKFIDLYITNFFYNKFRILFGIDKNDIYSNIQFEQLSNDKQKKYLNRLLRTINAYCNDKYVKKYLSEDEQENGTIAPIVYYEKYTTDPDSGKLKRTSYICDYIVKYNKATKRYIDMGYITAINKKDKYVLPNTKSLFTF